MGFDRTVEGSSMAFLGLRLQKDKSMSVFRMLFERRNVVIARYGEHSNRPVIALYRNNFRLAAERNIVHCRQYIHRGAILYTADSTYTGYGEQANRPVIALSRKNFRLAAGINIVHCRQYIHRTR
ncbi:hypothetical protein J6590_100787 [Homalodisca vitripennis]|nr:hypothetical protein J6590_100787 [Homalodisca vitripennis]